MTQVSVEQVEKEIFEWAATDPTAVEMNSKSWNSRLDTRSKTYNALENLLGPDKEDRITIPSGVLKLEQGVVDYQTNGGKESYWLTFSLKNDEGKRFFIVGAIEASGDIYWEDARLYEVQRNVKKTAHFSKMAKDNK